MLVVPRVCVPEPDELDRPEAGVDFRQLLNDETEVA
jgi:hypothetical protein